MAKLIVALLGLAFHFAASAQTLGLHLVSAHQHGGLNGINPGLYVRFDSGLTVGTYRNSWKKQSAYAAWSFESRQVAGFSAALTIGAVTGYRRLEGQAACADGMTSVAENPCFQSGAAVQVLFLPSVAYHVGDYALRVGVVPRPGAHGSAAAHLMIEHGF